MTTITCEHCESEIDVEKDPDCVNYDASGATDVMCKKCKELVWNHWRDSVIKDWDLSEAEQLRQAYGIKRGWRA